MSSHYASKILTRDQLLTHLHHARREGKTIVQCHGCFDLVHPGHIRYLEFARRQGDVLLVTLTGDGGVAKGPWRPYIPERLRAENLAALAFVDWVYVDPHPTAEQILELVQPDVYVKGAEYQTSRDPRFLAERRIVEQRGGHLIFSSGDVIFSSTRLIGRMLDGDADTHGLELVCSRYAIEPVSLARLMDRWASLNVTVVGDVIYDRYVLCDVQNVAREAPMLDLVFLEERSFVGGAGIIARHAAALGAKTRLVTRLGQDEDSREVETVANKEGVAITGLRRALPLPRKTRFLAEDAKLFKLDESRHMPLDTVDEERLAAQIREAAQHSDLVIFCDFGCGLLTPSLLSNCLADVRRAAGAVTADVSGRRANLLNFREVDLLCPTEREARMVLNDFESGLGHIAWHILSRTQAKRLVLTLDRRGLVTFEPPGEGPLGEEPEPARLRSEAFASFATRNVDRLGCGDAMLAAGSLALAAGASLVQAAYVGNAAAALEIAAWGNVPIAAAELREWLRGRAEFQLRPPPLSGTGSNDAAAANDAVDSVPPPKTRKRRPRPIPVAAPVP